MPMRDLEWIGSSLADLKRFPYQVMSDVGYALYFAQCGTKHESAKPLKGFGGAGVLEIVESFEGNAYRAVYTVRLKHAVYVLHCFQKKSHRGGRVPKLEQELVESRLRDAMALDRSKDGQKD
jgi:phage-related protein